MNKYIFIFILSMLFIFTSCSKTNQENNNQQQDSSIQQDTYINLNKSFKTTADIKFNGVRALININKKSPNTYDVEILEPSNLKGMTFSFVEDKINISYLGIKASLNKNSFITSAMVNSIINSINKVANESGINISKNSENISITGNSENGKFEMKLDKKNGSILNLNMPSINLECSFNNFTYN